MAKRSIGIRSNKQKEEIVSQDSTNQVSHSVVNTNEQVQFSLVQSPLPDPDDVAKFSKLLPDAPERLMRYAEKEQSFRHGLLTEQQQLINKKAARIHVLEVTGLVMAFAIFFMGMFISAILIYLGHPIGGSVFGGITLVGGASLFIANKQNDSTGESE
jgi:uncharacterized membrane protein